jgi:hypothetical protein
MKARKFLLLIACGLAAFYCSGNAAKPIGELSDYNCHISGFDSIPEIEFYVVKTFGSHQYMTLKIDHIASDSICIRQISNLKYSALPDTYISWDAALAKMENGKEYITSEIRSLFPNFRNAQTSYPLNNPFSDKGDFVVDDYMHIDKLDKKTTGTSIPFNLYLDKRVITHEGFQITSLGDYDKIPDYLAAFPDKFIFQTKRMGIDEYKALLSYAHTLDHHTLRIIDPVQYSDYFKTKATYTGRYKDMFSLGTRLFFFIPLVCFSILFQLVLLILFYKPVIAWKNTGQSSMWIFALHGALATVFTVSVCWWVFPMLFNDFTGYLIAIALFSIALGFSVYAIILRVPWLRALCFSAVCNLGTLGILVYFFSLF